MSSPARPMTVNPEDADRADGVIRALIEDPPGAPGNIQGSLRGLLIGAFADCRQDAYADALADYRAASSDPEPDRGIGCWPPADDVVTLAGERLDPQGDRARQARAADQRGRWARNPGDLPPAVADALQRCPTCGTPWPEAVDVDERTPCEPTP